jgi:hypothetical protein
MPTVIIIVVRLLHPSARAWRVRGVRRCCPVIGSCCFPRDFIHRSSRARALFVGFTFTFRHQKHSSPPLFRAFGGMSSRPTPSAKATVSALGLPSELLEQLKQVHFQIPH